MITAAVIVVLVSLCCVSGFFIAWRQEKREKRERLQEVKRQRLLARDRLIRTAVQDSIRYQDN